MNLLTAVHTASALGGHRAQKRAWGVMNTEKNITSQKSISDIALKVDDLYIIGDPPEVHSQLEEDESFRLEHSKQHKGGTSFSQLSKPVLFSYLAILLRQIFGNQKLRSMQAVQSHKLMEAKPFPSKLQEADGDERSNPYTLLLNETLRATRKVRVNQVDLALVVRLCNDLDSIITYLQPSSKHDHSIYSQLVVARKLLEIIIVLFDDVEGLDELHRLIQRQKAFLYFKRKLASIVEQWTNEGIQDVSPALREQLRSVVSSPNYIYNKEINFRSHLAADRTTNVRPAGNPSTPPPSPPPPPPPEEKPKK